MEWDLEHVIMGMVYYFIVEIWSVERSFENYAFIQIEHFLYIFGHCRGCRGSQSDNWDVIFKEFSQSSQKLVI